MKLLRMLSATLGLMALFASCEMDLRHAPVPVQKSFDSLFPEAHHVRWEKEMTLYKAEFHNASHEMEAWFEKDGTWKRSKTELLLSEVPDTVLQATKEFSKGAWEIDDIDYYEQPAGIQAFYRIEFDKEHSERERILRLRPDGTIITDLNELL